MHYIMGSTIVDDVFDKRLSGVEREDKLLSAVRHFEAALKALKSTPDLDMEQECHRRLGLTLLQLYICDPVEIAASGLHKRPDLERAVNEMEKALELEAKVQEKMFTDRAIASAVLLPLDTIWMYQSMYTDQMLGPEQAVKYLESKMEILDPLGGVNLPGTCFMLHTHYLSCLESQSPPSSYDSFKADQYLEKAVNGEAYEDVAAGTTFCVASSHYKKKAQERKEDYHNLEQRMYRAMFHFQEGLEARKRGDFDKAITEFDESILSSTDDTFLMEVDPRAADFAVSAYFELAQVIVLKFNLRNKQDLSDEEFLWLGRVLKCAKRQIELHDKFIVGTDRADDKLRLYNTARQLMQMEPRYLTYKKNGKTDVSALPAIRCLAEEENQEILIRTQEIKRRVREKLCVACGKSLGVLDKLRSSQIHSMCAKRQ